LYLTRNKGVSLGGLNQLGNDGVWIRVFRIRLVPISNVSLVRFKVVYCLI
jgi:hypothetical protein